MAVGEKEQAGLLGLHLRRFMAYDWPTSLLGFPIGKERLQGLPLEGSKLMRWGSAETCQKVGFVLSFQKRMIHAVSRRECMSRKWQNVFLVLRVFGLAPVPLDGLWMICITRCFSSAGSFLQLGFARLGETRFKLRAQPKLGS
jgi:hypothetical protein